MATNPIADLAQQVAILAQTNAALVAAVQAATASVNNVFPTLAADTGSTLIGTAIGQDLQSMLNDLVSLPDYAALRAFAGADATGAVLYAPGITGVFRYEATDLASADNGATVIVDALGRRWKRRYSGKIDAQWFGLSALGTASANTAALTAAVVFANAQGGGAVYTPEGRYALAGPVPMLRKVRIVGDGPDQTVFAPAFAGTVFPLDLTYLTPVAGSPDASVGFAEFQIDCGSQAGVTGIDLVNCRYTWCQNLKFKGCANNIVIDRGRNHSIDTAISEGTSTLKAGGFVFTSSDDADYIFETQVRGLFFFNNYATGTAAVLVYLRRGALVHIDGVTVNDGAQGNTPAAVGIMVENDCQGCKVSNVVLPAVSNGLVLQVGAGVSAAPTYCAFDNVDIDQATGAGLLVEAAAWNTFDNCKFSSSGVATTISAAVLRAGAQGNVFTSCSFQGYNGIGGNGLYTENSSDNAVRSCIFGQNTAGVFFGSGVVRCSVHGNIFVGNAANIAGTPAQAGISIKNNTGHLLTTNLAPAVPATTVAATNNTGYAVSAHVVGGTVTDVAVSGVSTNRAGGEYRVEPGQTIAMTYTVAPTWAWLPSWG